MAIIAMKIWGKRGLIMEDLCEVKVINNMELVKNIEKIKAISKSREVVFLCIGNSKVWYDSFGPMIGTLFQHLNIKNHVYGNIKANVNADNLQEYINIIYKYHYNPYIVVFDNAVSAENEFMIKIQDKPVSCACLSDNPFFVGDMSVLCLTPVKQVKNVCKYFNMLKQIKKLGMYFKEFYM